MKAVLPEKTFYKDVYTLKESDYDCMGRLSVKKTMEFMQNVATAHAEKLGFGWDSLHAKGILWVLSKAKVRFVRPVTREVKTLTLYTWPLQPDRYFAAREFTAVDEKGEPLFYATSLWNVIDLEKRNFVATNKISELCQTDYSDVRSDIPHNFVRVQQDEDFEVSYAKQVRRSDLDINMHVNNTNYIAYALDGAESFDKSNLSAFEITYHAECRLGDTVTVLEKTLGRFSYIVGVKNDGKTSFTALLEKDD